MCAQSLFVCVCLSLSHTQTGNKHVQISDILLSLLRIEAPPLFLLLSYTFLAHGKQAHSQKKCNYYRKYCGTKHIFCVSSPPPQKKQNARCYSHACSPIYLYCILVRTQILSLSLSFWLFLALVHFYLHNPATSMLFTDIPART